MEARFGGDHSSLRCRSNPMPGTAFSGSDIFVYFSRELDTGYDTASVALQLGKIGAAMHSVPFRSAKGRKSSAKKV